MFDFFAKSKKTKTADDGGESLEASYFSSSLSPDCPSDKSASVQIPMKVKHRLHQISPAPAERKKLKSNLFKKFGLEIING